LEASVWRDQQQVLAAPGDLLNPPTGVVSGFAVSGELGLGASIKPGKYVLQISATTYDRKRGKKPRLAVQQAEFEVR
jgi:hypothetical protein